MIDFSKCETTKDYDPDHGCDWNPETKTCWRG